MSAALFDRTQTRSRPLARQNNVCGHARNPLAPNYEASEYYSGSRRGRHGIAPSLSAHVARVMKDESEIEKQRSKAREPGDGKGGDRKEHK